VSFLVRQVVFSAPSDEDAAALLHAGPPSGVVCAPGVVGLWGAEAILRRRSFAAVLDEQPEPVADVNDGERVVVRLSAALRDGLAALSGLRGASFVVRWSDTREVRAEGLTQESTRELVGALRDLARQAMQAGAELYLWVAVDDLPDGCPPG
jgi:hypothetical protein